MNLLNDTARCYGNNCPSKKNCMRYTVKPLRGDYTLYAAFYARREAGADACDSIIPVRQITTFIEQVAA